MLLFATEKSPKPSKVPGAPEVSAGLRAPVGAETYECPRLFNVFVGKLNSVLLKI